MSAVYNPEADSMARIEQLEQEARRLRRCIDHTQNEEDARVLRRQLSEIKDEIVHIQIRLPW